MTKPPNQKKTKMANAPMADGKCPVMNAMSGNKHIETPIAKLNDHLSAVATGRRVVVLLTA
jgi:hypothetical protein